MKPPPGNAEPQLGSGNGAGKPNAAGKLEDTGRAGARRSQERHSQARSQGSPWYSRGYLPHFEGTAVIQSITFRLADSLPQETLHRMEREIAGLGNDEQGVERRKRIEHWLDAGMGCCALRHPVCADLMQDTLLRFDGERYRLLAWCVMPNHVHVMIEPTHPLGKIVQSWKSFTGRWAVANSAKLNLGVSSGGFWMREYWDRFIRDERHYARAIDYIHQNPVAAGLCREPEEWRWSSAFPGNAEPQLGSKGNVEERKTAELGLGAPRNDAPRTTP